MAQSKLYRSVISRISKKEKGKKQISVGNVREVVGIVCDLQRANPRIRQLMHQMAYDRAQARARAAKKKTRRKAKKAA